MHCYMRDLVVCIDYHSGLKTLNNKAKKWLFHFCRLFATCAMGRISLEMNEVRWPFCFKMQ